MGPVAQFSWLQLNLFRVQLVVFGVEGRTLFRRPNVGLALVAPFLMFFLAGPPIFNQLRFLYVEKCWLLTFVIVFDLTQVAKNAQYSTLPHIFRSVRTRYQVSVAWMYCADTHTCGEGGFKRHAT